MSRHSIRSSIPTIQSSVEKGSIELEYDSVFRRYKKNNVSSYTLHLLINTLQNHEKADIHIVNSKEFYTQNTSAYDSEMQEMEKSIRNLKNEIVKCKSKNTRLSYICFIFLLSNALTLFMLLYEII